ncbi:MAG: hypothetical protein ACLTZH_13790 [Subdoligranulum sp.]
MPPIRVLQIMPAMDAGGMETFVMNVYRAVDRSQVQFDFCTTMISPAFMMLKLKPWAGTLPS